MTDIERRPPPRYGLVSLLAPFAGILAGLVLTSGEQSMYGLWVNIFLAALCAAGLGGGAAYLSFAHRERLPGLAVIGGLASVGPVIVLLVLAGPTILGFQ